MSDASTSAETTVDSKQGISLISGFSRRLFVSTTLAMIVAAVLSLMATVVLFNTSLRPYLLEKAHAVAESVQLDIAYAMEIGIPFDKIRGLDAHIATLVAEHPEVADLRVVISSDGDALDFTSGNCTSSAERGCCQRGSRRGGYPSADGKRCGSCCG